MSERLEITAEHIQPFDVLNEGSIVICTRLRTPDPEEQDFARVWLPEREPPKPITIEAGTPTVVERDPGVFAVEWSNPHVYEFDLGDPVVVLRRWNPPLPKVTS